MGFPEQRAKASDAVFRALGEDALWSGIVLPVRIRFSTTDEDQKLSDSRFISRSTTIRVRASDVATPAEDDQVTVASGPNIGVYQLIGDPILGPKRVWECAMKTVQPAPVNGDGAPD